MPPCWRGRVDAGAYVSHMAGVQGRQGVATALGVLLAISWPVGLIACATWLLVAAVLRYSSLSALVALGISPAIGWYFAGPQVAQLCAFIAVLVFIRHHANIRRLCGEEPKIGSKKKAEPAT